MLVGVGTDILRIDRIGRCLDSPSFMRRTFTEGELGVGSRRPDRAAYYANLFAAKEAVFKCLGIAADELGCWLSIEILDSEEARPQVRLSGTAARAARARGVGKVMLSLSSDTDYSVAFAAALAEAADGD